MKPFYLTPQALTDFIKSALREDVGDGDHSSLASIPAEAQNQARLLVKDNGILAGVELAEMIFKEVETLQGIGLFDIRRTQDSVPGPFLVDWSL